MKFGKVDDVRGIDFKLPKDHKDTKTLLQQADRVNKPIIYVGCAKWNRQDLKNFYPRGTKDELTYYASQFNSIELNASFYRIFSAEQFAKWAKKVPADFRFFPKVFQGISHWKRLQDAERYVEEYVYAVNHLEDKLEMCFLQLPENFSPTEDNQNRLTQFVSQWPKSCPLAIELRHTDWFNNQDIAQKLYATLEKQFITNIITDTAGRRDLLHMRLTTPIAFIRYVGANHSSDYKRVEEWVVHIKQWVKAGIQNIYFFVHQNNEVESVNIAHHFIEQINEALSIDLKTPQVISPQS